MQKAIAPKLQDGLLALSDFDREHGAAALFIDPNPHGNGKCLCSPWRDC